MPTAKLKQCDIYYEIEGEGAPLILIHGLSADHTIWSGLIPYLRHTFRIICLDLRGSGQTRFDGAPFTLEDLADDVAALMEHLHLVKAHLVGHSMGGRVAMTFAGRHQKCVERLGIINSLLELTYPARRHFEAMANLREHYDIALEDLRYLGLPWVFSGKFLQSEANIEMLRELVKNNLYPQSLGNYRLQLEALKQFDGHQFTAKFTMPILILTGSEDILCPPGQMRALAQTLASAVYVEQEQGAHALIVETPEWVAEQLRQFFLSNSH